MKEKATDKTLIKQSDKESTTVIKYNLQMTVEKGAQVLMGDVSVGNVYRSSADSDEVNALIEKFSKYRKAVKEEPNAVEGLKSSIKIEKDDLDDSSTSSNESSLSL